MRGTLVNAGAVLGGSLLGLRIGPRLPDALKGTLMQALGLSVLVLGLRMALSGGDVLLPIGCLLLGGVTGELLDIERRLEGLGEWLRDRLRFGSETFAEGFASASLLYLTGAMMIVGSIRDGTLGDPTTLYVKALLDGVASVALASSLGSGVAFSALSVLTVQGGITLLASRLLFLQRPDVLAAVTATGGMLIAAIGINLLELRRLRTGNLLPAVFYAIAAVLLGLG
ncbi:MAG: DUF554 domain-containing protein [Deltaproteobacteria bacterium]|nr:DUF554 domain-containing protein [Deltaproteobacteria bacterium]